MTIQYGPIRQWPGKLRSSYERKRAPFKASHTGTLRMLESELKQINAESVVVQLAIDANQFTIEGRPYAQARSQHPGVIVSFTKRVRTKTGVSRFPLSFPCDTYQTWESNLRAIALALRALRAVDRYGVTQNAEQYTGFKQLPPPGPSDEQIQTVEDAARFVAAFNGSHPSEKILNDAEAWRASYRNVASKFHPDKRGGEQLPQWAKLQAAHTLLEHHHQAVPC